MIPSCDCLSSFVFEASTSPIVGRESSRAHHGGVSTGKLCANCNALIDSMMERVENCPNDHEQNCEDCDTKCQRGEDAERIREVMRFAAPRMLARHPIMTLRYLRKKF